MRKMIFWLFLLFPVGAFAQIPGSVQQFGTVTASNCVSWKQPGVIQDAGAACGGSGGTPGGSNTQVQYNNAGSFGGITGATTNGTALSLVAPVLGTPASGVITNLTGTCTACTANSVTTNANLTGVITSVGNATSIASQTGTGTTFAVQTSPSFLTSILGNTTSILTFPAAATWQFGAADAASPVAQTVSFQSVVAGTSNTAGANATFKASAGTGTGAGGSLIFQVAAAGSTGTSQNSFATALTIDSTKLATFAGNAVVFGGTLTIGPDGANKGLITYTTNTLTFSPAGGGATYTFDGNNGIGLNVWSNGTPITIGSGGNQGGNTNRAGSPISIQPKGGSGNGTAAWVELHAGLATTSGTTGHTDELAVRTQLLTTAQSMLLWGGATSSFPALKRVGAALNFRLADDSADAAITALSLSTSTAATFQTTTVALTNGAGASAGTITNAPSVGNPTKWIGINDNGTTRYIPAW